MQPHNAGMWPPLINAFQLRAAPDEAGLLIIQQPSPVANDAGKSVKLSVLAAGNNDLAYQWQKVVNGGGRDLFDDNKFSGTASNELVIKNLSADDAGSYRVLIRDKTGL